MKRFLTGVLFCTLFAGCTNENKKPEKQVVPAPDEGEVPAIEFSFVRTLPHDTTSYTQGLLVHGGKFYESTGSPREYKQTRSVWGILDTTTGKIALKAELDREKYFGEGIAVLGNKLYQLTWTGQTGFVYDLKSGKLLEQFHFASKEGWGLTTDGVYLIMSDGSGTISYLDPQDFKVVKTLKVPYANLNELEFINGSIYANVYQKDFIVKIDTTTGEVRGLLDLSPLVYKARLRSRNAEVPNGIAFDPGSGRIWVTGKLWPVMYEIKFPL